MVSTISKLPHPFGQRRSGRHDLRFAPPAAATKIGPDALIDLDEWPQAALSGGGFERGSGTKARPRLLG